MKKLMVVLASAMAACLFAGADGLVSNDTFDDKVFLSSKEYVEQIMFKGEYCIGARSATTNLVFARAIRTESWVPCACPDGDAGCLVMHYRKVVETRYEPVEFTCDDGMYSMKKRGFRAELEELSRQYPEIDIATLVFQDDSHDVVGFVDLEAIRRSLEKKSSSEGGSVQ